MTRGDDNDSSTTGQSQLGLLPERVERGGGGGCIHGKLPSTVADPEFFLGAVF